MINQYPEAGIEIGQSAKPVIIINQVLNPK